MCPRGRAVEPPQWWPVSNPNLYVWMALRRVHDGHATRSAGAYFDSGRPVPGHLTGVFDWLVWRGFVSVADGDPIWSLRRLSLTDTGQARYAELCIQFQNNPTIPPPEHRNMSSQNYLDQGGMR